MFNPQNILRKSCCQFLLGLGQTRTFHETNQTLIWVDLTQVKIVRWDGRRT